MRTIWRCKIRNNFSNCKKFGDFLERFADLEDLERYAILETLECF